MKPLFFSALLLLPLLPVDRVGFDPTPGSSVTKSFAAEIQVELEDVSVALGGQELDPSMFGDPEILVGITLQTTVTDEYTSVDGGRPTVLSRTFDEILAEFEVEQSAMGESNNESSSASSALEGETVLFRWDAGSEEYAVEFAEDGDEELLEGLEEDMDLRFLLPDGEVSEGDSWDIDPETLRHIITPGGDLSLEPDDADGDEMDEELSEALEDILAELFSGEATATYRGVEDDLATIGLAVEIDSNMDVGSVLSNVIDTDGEMSLDVADVQVVFEGEGILVWNVAANRLHSFELSGDATMGIDVEMTQEQMGTIEASIELSGAMSFQTTVE